MAVETTRTRQLRKLAEGVPGANQKVAQGLQQARTTQLQAQIGAMQPGVGGPQAAQQIGAQQAGQAGQIALQAQQAGQQQAKQIGQMGLQQQQVEAQKRIGEEQREVSAKARDFSNRLNNISNEAKDELLDRQLEFQTDEAGRTLMNQRQLADWAATKARSEEEFRNYQQMATQASQRKIQYLETMHRSLTQAMEQGYIMEGKKLDFEARKNITVMQQNLARKLASEKRHAAENQRRWAAIGTVGGAVIGGIAGGPGGAKTGASVGSGAGKAFGAAN